MNKKVITLISDWGWDDVSLGMMKWELYKLFPDAIVVDLMHDVELLNVNQTAFIMSHLYNRFPEGSMHLLLTGISHFTTENPVAVKMDGHFFVGIDNGVLPYMFPNVELPTRCFVGEEGGCFEKIGHLVQACLEDRYEDETDAMTLTQQYTAMSYSYSRSSDVLTGHVMYIDSHHNVVTDIPVDFFKEILGDRSFQMRMNGMKINVFHEHFVQEYEPFLVPNSFGVIEIVSYGAKLALAPRWFVDQEIEIEFS